jgi:sugar/nucleoside kinase (ribokinase family)
MMLLKPTEREARLALRDFNSGLVVLAEALRKKANAENIVLTLGSEGLLIHAPNEREQGWLTDQLPAFNLAPKDTAGAGDSFLVMSSLALLVGASIWQSAYLGSIAAACQVGRIGNVPLTPADIEKEIDN